MPAIMKLLCVIALIYSHWQNQETIIPGLAPHSVYMCTPEILRETTALAAKPESHS